MVVKISQEKEKKKKILKKKIESTEETRLTFRIQY